MYMGYVRLQSAIFKRGYDNYEISKRLGITEEELNLKFNKRISFTIEEIINLTDILNLKNPEKYFFPEKERKSIN